MIERSQRCSMTDFHTGSGRGMSEALNATEGLGGPPYD